MADHDSRAGARYATPEILTLLDALHHGHDGRDAALAAAFAAPDAEGMPAIEVGPAEGRLLELLARLVGARRAVEVGTLAGYSAIRIARGLVDGGRLWTLELDARHAEVARRRIAAAGLDDRVEVVVGAAQAILPRLEPQGPFDLVFVDADKEGYLEYGRWAARALRRGGLLVADNVYLFGNLLGDTPAAVAMRRFHQEAAEAFDTACVTTPDGLLVGVKR